MPELLNPSEVGEASLPPILKAIYEILERDRVFDQLDAEEIADPSSASTTSDFIQKKDGGIVNV